jgi:hypothetical protein
VYISFIVNHKPSDYKMKHYTVLYSDPSFRLKVGLDGKNSTTLCLGDEAKDMGTVQVIFHHSTEEGNKHRLALQAAVDAFNAAWQFFQTSAQHINEDMESPITELRIF